MPDPKELADALALRARALADLYWYEHQRTPDVADFREAFLEVLEKFNMGSTQS